MDSIDLTPLYRSSIGFDHFGALLDTALRSNKTTTGYPPYDIEVLDENEYSITLAVTGFEESELDIQVEKDVLTVSGKRKTEEDKDYLYRGITSQSFEQKFNLAEYIEVSGARLRNGLLTINLVKEVPEAMKPRRIKINNASRVIEHDSGEKVA